MVSVVLSGQLLYWWFSVGICKYKPGYKSHDPAVINRVTLVKSSRIYTGQYTFPILLLNDDNMLGEHKGREKNIVYGRLF